MGEQGAPGQTLAHKGSIQRVEARMGSLGGIQIVQADRVLVRKPKALIGW